MGGKNGHSNLRLIITVFQATLISGCDCAGYVIVFLLHRLAGVLTLAPQETVNHSINIFSGRMGRGWDECPARQRSADIHRNCMGYATIPHYYFL